MLIVPWCSSEFPKLYICNALWYGCWCLQVLLLVPYYIRCCATILISIVICSLLHDLLCHCQIDFSLLISIFILKMTIVAVHIDHWFCCLKLFLLDCYTTTAALHYIRCCATMQLSATIYTVHCHYLRSIYYTHTFTGRHKNHIHCK